ncbi:MAG TPA: HyaD/HybD family hydrogenase maturation endopeptidase [Acidobacteriaceae bacterium]|jgi:hydrogenase maturation protease|nr:HyaD/HybD family hydrogenase maturation endopeptidase [Acidobacteriaceae bacterium]
MIAARIAVLGLGNLMRADDAVGMLAVEAMRADPRMPPSILLIDGGTLGLDLLYPIEGITHLLALDAIEAGEAPGTVLRYAGDAIAEMPVTKSVHLLGFSDLIGAMRLIGTAPREIVVLGVQPAVIAWGTELTPAVRTALPKLLEAAFAQLEAWQSGAWTSSVAESQRPSATRPLDQKASPTPRPKEAARLCSPAPVESAWYW